MLSSQDKEKCVELYYWATQRTSSPSNWNEDAAELLSELYAVIARCSLGVDYVPRPPGSKPGVAWLLTYVYQALAAKMNGNKRIYDACRPAGALKYISAIEIAFGN